MTKFILKGNEKILADFHEVYVYANDNEYVVDVYLTNERLVLLKDISDELGNIDVLKGRGVSFPAEYEIIFDVLLSELKDIKYNDKFNQIVFTNRNDVLEIYCDNLNSYINL